MKRYNLRCVRAIPAFRGGHIESSVELNLIFIECFKKIQSKNTTILDPKYFRKHLLKTLFLALIPLFLTPPPSFPTHTFQNCGFDIYLYVSEISVVDLQLKISPPIQYKFKGVC